MIRLRVYPQNGMWNNGWNGGVRRRRPASLYAQQLRAERQQNQLRIRYERALWRQQLQMSQLSNRAPYGANAGYGAYAGWGAVAQPTPVVYPGGYPGMYPGYNPCYALNAQRNALNAAVGVTAIRNVFASSNGFWGNIASMF